MPGIFGGTGCPRGGYESLSAAYSDAWGKGACEEVTADGALIGGHAFGAERAVYSFRDYDVGVDGDGHCYRRARRWKEERGEPVLTMEDGFVELHPEVACNGVAVHRESGRLYMASDWAGSFPMYYARWRGGLLFANLLRPLARVVGPERDRIGVLQYLRHGYVYGNRTPFRSIRRLRPGEALRFDPHTGDLSTEDRSRLWVGEPVEESERPARLCLRHLERSLGESLQAASAPALMMSGGWDSRTLLAASRRDRLGAGDDGRPLLGFGHGDVDSRELTLVRRLCLELGVECHLEPIDDRILRLSRLHDDFARTGTALFPHWHRSGRVLAARDRDTAMSGIFGEVLGGHYGRTMTATGLGKAISFLRESRSTPDRSGSEDPVDLAMGALRVEIDESESHWYLDPDFEHSLGDRQARINADLRQALARLRDRGVNRQERLIEACISEHRGSQYIAGQSMSSRTAVDVSMPFSDRALLHVASRIPQEIKIHNSLNRQILELIDSPVLELPLAATLAPASAPLFVQEASRAVRKLWETGGWRLHLVSRGVLPEPRLSWVNFEFLRDSDEYRALVGDLRSDLWDRSAIEARLDRIQERPFGERLHPLFDQIGKIYTIDRLLA